MGLLIIGGIALAVVVAARPVYRWVQWMDARDGITHGPRERADKDRDD